MNALLYTLVVLIWGSTWMVIAYQAGTVPVLFSLFARFLLASFSMLLLTLLRGRLRKIGKRDLFFSVLQGLCLYSLNYLCFYFAALSISSGMESLIFSLAIIGNALGGRIFWKQQIRRNFLPAVLAGLTGLFLILSRDIAATDHRIPTWAGVLLCLMGTGFFCLGNMISISQFKAGLSPLLSNTYAMTAGASILLILMLASGTPFVLPEDPVYLLSLLYLAIAGTVAAFTCYLTLVNRTGAQKAAFVTVMTPIIALGLSVLLEGQTLSKVQIVGILLILAANVLMQSPGHLSKGKTGRCLKG